MERGDLEQARRLTAAGANVNWVNKSKVMGKCGLEGGNLTLMMDQHQS